MGTRKVRDVVASLLRKGFREIPAGDHRYFRFYAGEDATAVRTKVSRGERDLEPWHLKMMAKQVHLSSREFDRLIECPLSLEEYRQILLTKGEVDPADPA